jgi:hypothetical protein
MRPDLAIDGLPAILVCPWLMAVNALIEGLVWVIVWDFELLDNELLEMSAMDAWHIELEAP